VVQNCFAKKLVQLDWSLGMAVRSSTKELDTPYVSVVAHIADANGVLSSTSFELSLAEFKVRMDFIFLLQLTLGRFFFFRTFSLK